LELSLVSLASVEALFHEYGYAAIFFCLLLESIGFPLPGESLLVAAAVYAATTHRFNIFAVVPLAAAGAIGGDQIGYWIGRALGAPLLEGWGRRVGLSQERLDLGRFLFLRYGGRVVFLGRFVAFLRTFAALLAGANRMTWPRFLLWNALGGIAWTCLYGFGAYLLGDAARRVTGPVGIALAAVGTAALAGAVVFVRRNEGRLLAQARLEMAAERVGSA
jgi:membrane protein DedA with SNARE-associated domain